MRPWRRFRLKLCQTQELSNGTREVVLSEQPFGIRSVSRRATLCFRVLRGMAGSESPFLEALTHYGCEATLICDDGDGIPPAGEWLVIFGNAAWYPNVCARLLGLAPERRPNVLLWHSEPLPPARATGLPMPWLNLREIAKIALRDARATDVYTNYLTIRKLHRAGIPDVLVLSSRGRQDFLAERGIPGHFAPLGCDPSMGRDLGIARDIDVLFLGILNVPRRNRLLRSLREQNINLTEAGSWTDPAYWGENRTRLLNRAKILVNLARTPAEFSGYRLSLGMANKALVVSEPMYRPEPFVPGEHFLMAPTGEMAGCIRHYLDHESERHAITERAYVFVKEEATLMRSTERMVRLMEEHEQRRGRR